MLYNILNEVLTEPQKEYIEWNNKDTDTIVFALDKAMINGSWSISSVYYAQLNPKLWVKITRLLSKLNIVNSIVQKNYSQVILLESFILNHIDKSELDAYRINERIEQYTCKYEPELQASNLTRTCYGISDTGLNRPGFAKAANKFTWKYDTELLSKYREPIVKNVVKGIAKQLAKKNINSDKFLADNANYGAIATSIIDYYIANTNRKYNGEYNINDPRGRASFGCSKRIFNPIGYKDARALMVSTKPIRIQLRNDNQMNDIWYFIAELSGSKATSEEGKYEDGKSAYENRWLPELDLSKPSDRKDLHELIWLERIYNKLNKLYASATKTILWDIPLEVDSSMSIMQWAALILQSEQLADRTNMTDKPISDPWFIEGVRRKAGKSYGTPVMYGSSQSAVELMKVNGMEPIGDELAIINKEFSKGDFAIMKHFKDCLIKSTNITTPWIDVTIWNETFQIPVNRFKMAKTERVFTTSYNTSSNKLKVSITHKPVMVPDYNRFKIATGTLLIHHLDSIGMDKIANEFDILPIHDAALGLPGTMINVRTRLAEIQTELFKVGPQVLANYRKSIGAVGRTADIRFMRLDKTINKLSPDFKVSKSAMK